MEIRNFNQTIDIWIAELPKFSLGQLQLRPDGDSWSLGQVYLHLIKDSNWFLEQITVALEDNQNRHKPATVEGRALLEWGSFADVRIKGNETDSKYLRQPMSVAELQVGLLKLKQNTNELWETMKRIPVGGKSEHPGLGFLSAKEWVRFMEMHLRHHLRQKERLENFLAQAQPVRSPN